METINVVDVCRLCLAEHNGFSESLSDWIHDVLLIFGLKLFLDDGLPQQICRDCHHTLIITTKLKDTVYEKDKLLKTYHKTDIKPDFATRELNKIVDVKSNINNVKQSEEYTIKIEETLDIKFNYPNLNDSATTSNSRPIIKSEMRVILEKLPIHISSNSFIYCSKCLLAFTDSDRFNIHLNLNIHSTNKCSSCSIMCKNLADLWKHFNSVHVDENLKITENSRMNTINGEDEPTLTVEKQQEHHTNMSEVQEKGINVCDHKVEERRRKRKEYMLKKRATMTEEERLKIAEYYRKWRANITVEQRRKRAERERKKYAKLTKEQRRKKTVKRYANMTDEQRKKRAEDARRRRANLKEKIKKNTEPPNI